MHAQYLQDMVRTLCNLNLSVHVNLCLILQIFYLTSPSEWYAKSHEDRHTNNKKGGRTWLYKNE